MLLGREIVDNFHSAAVKEYLGGERPANHIAEADLAKLTMPVLLLWGRSEKLLPYEGLDYFRAHLPRHALIEEVEGFGHSPHIESAGRLVERIQQFLGSLPRM
jgi:pimeloyl-ACP methyl ester carboxylesterase